MRPPLRFRDVPGYGVMRTPNVSTDDRLGVKVPMAALIEPLEPTAGCATAPPVGANVATLLSVVNVGVESDTTTLVALSEPMFVAVI